jgi:FdhD protein
MNEFVRKNIIRYRNGVKTEEQDAIVSETYIKLTIQCEKAGTLTCTPSFLEDLAAGYLVTSGIVTDENRLIHLEYIAEKHKFDVTLENNDILKDKKFEVLKPVGCAGGDQVYVKSESISKNKADVTISGTQISALMREFNKTSDLFRETGGVHSAALATQDKILVFREDIGRHNAVDKVVGAMYLSKQALDDKILLTSGRISSEIVLKTINSDIQMIISRSAPTQTGIELAEENGITLIGFARADNFNVYSGFERVIIDSLI